MPVKEYDKRSHKKYNREKMTSISFRLHNVTDADLLEVYRSIPDKMKWFREALRREKEEH